MENFVNGSRGMHLMFANTRDTVGCSNAERGAYGPLEDKKASMVWITKECVLVWRWFLSDRTALRPRARGKCWKLNGLHCLRWPWSCAFGQLLNLFFFEICCWQKIKPNTQPVGCPGNAKHVLGAGDQGKH